MVGFLGYTCFVVWLPDFFLSPLLAPGAWFCPLCMYLDICPFPYPQQIRLELTVKSMLASVWIIAQEQLYVAFRLGTYTPCYL
jgi:hypothetical protein